VFLRFLWENSRQQPPCGLPPDRPPHLQPEPVMNLMTNYLGLSLRSPFIVGASPFCDNLETCRALEKAGAGALVMRSLFAEQLEPEPDRALVAHHTEWPATSDAEAFSQFPRDGEYSLSPEQYLQHIAELKKTLTIPVIASLNGNLPGEWVECARRIEHAGADALELNFYQLVTDADVSCDQVEMAYIEILRSVRQSVSIPIAVKLSPYHTALPQFCRQLETSGADGLVLFNRFYQPDINIDDYAVVPQLRLSDSSELLLRLRWLSILSPQVHCSLSCSGGVHFFEDAVKALLAGSHSLQVVSAILRQGPGYLAVLNQGLQEWMKERGYTSLAEFRGAMNLRRCRAPGEHERANYIKVLQSWRV
jgi:dihydroorotate dehydrogenase (fumarate)